jgi:hypothetical protein
MLTLERDEAIIDLEQGSKVNIHARNLRRRPHVAGTIDRAPLPQSGTDRRGPVTSLVNSVHFGRRDFSLSHARVQ